MSVAVLGWWDEGRASDPRPRMEGHGQPGPAASPCSLPSQSRRREAWSIGHFILEAVISTSKSSWLSKILRGDVLCLSNLVLKKASWTEMRILMGAPQNVLAPLSAAD